MLSRSRLHLALWTIAHSNLAELVGKPCCVRLYFRMQCKWRALASSCELSWTLSVVNFEWSTASVRLRCSSLSAAVSDVAACSETQAVIYGALHRRLATKVHKLLCAFRFSTRVQVPFTNAPGCRTDESVEYALYRSDRISRSSAVRAVAIAVASSASSLHAPTAKGQPWE